MFQCGSLWVHLPWDVACRTWKFVSFSRFGKFSGIIFPNGYFSPSLLWGSHSVGIAHLMLSLRLSSPLSPGSLSAALCGWVSSFRLLVCWATLFRITVCCWTLLVCFPVQLLDSSALWLLFGSFLYFLPLCWRSRCVHPFFSWACERLYDQHFEFFIK